MKRLSIIILTIIFLIVGTIYAQEQEQQHQPVHSKSQLQENTGQVWIPFTGKWLPDVRPEMIGAFNYKMLQNMRPVDGGIEGVQGSTKINTTAITTYTEMENGFHFIKDQPSESHVIIASGDSGTTDIYVNDTAIPNQGNFSATTLYRLDSSAGFPRMSSAPGGHIVICNGKENLIWGGDEMNVLAFITSTDDIGTGATIHNAQDYLDQVSNKLEDGDEVVTIGGGNDGDTVLLLHFEEGKDVNSPFIDSSTTGHALTGTTNPVSSPQRKFGVAGVSLTSSFISVADSNDFNMTVDKFTIDFWVRFAEDKGPVYPYFEQYLDNDNYVLFSKSSDDRDVCFTVADSGSTTVNLHTNYDFSNDIWYHIAIIRGWNNNSDTFAITVDGSAVTTATYSGVALPDIAGDFIIGSSHRLHKADEDDFSGWMDEFRVTKTKARWTSDFNPPVREYLDTSLYWVIGAPRPISGISFYVKDGNQGTDQTVTVEEWTGEWSGVSVSGTSPDPTNGLERSGKISFSSTVNTSKPKYLEDKLLYFYKCTLSGGEATVYNVTLDIPMQPILDLWDGVYRTPISFQSVRTSGTSDFTLEVNESSSELYPIGAKIGGTNGGSDIEYVIIIFEDRVQAVYFDVLDINSTQTSSGLSVFTWNGESWVTAYNVWDETNTNPLGRNGWPLNRSGVITWTPPEEEEEFQRAMFGVRGYAYKFRWNATLDTPGNPDDTMIDLVYGISAPKEVPPFKFPATYKNRTLLCGYTEGNEGNRIDFSATNTTEVWNGLESSMNGIQSLYVGSNEDLTAAAQIYNRYGSNIITSLALTKDTETYLLLGDGPEDFRILPISQNIGCPAPLTMTTAEVNYTIGGGAEAPARNIAIWLSYSGLIVFDGSVLIPIGGIDSYFDPADENYVGASAIKDASGWYDQTYKEYNLRVAGYWFVINLEYLRWYTKYAPAMPEFGFPVHNTSGSRYIYSGTTTGNMMRLENGTTWDGTAIAQIVETGDFYLDNNPWHQSELRRLKLMSRRISEAATVQITHYSGTTTSGTSLFSVALNQGTDDTNRVTGGNLDSEATWLHRFKFEVSTSSTDKGWQPVGWGYQYQGPIREDW